MLQRWSSRAHCWVRVLALLAVLMGAGPSGAAEQVSTARDAQPEVASADLDGIWPAPERGLPAPSLGRTLPWVLLAALGYGLLVGAKSRAVQRAARLRKVEVRPLVGLFPSARALLSGGLLVAASSAVLWLDSSLLAALALAIALAVSAHRPPRSEVPLRGPGQWQPLDSAALEPPAPPPLPGAWLDVGRPQGCAVLLGALTAIAAVAMRLFDGSPYYGACLTLGSAALLPIFCTGRAAELPEPGLAQSRRFLAQVLKALSGTPELAMQPLGRFCTGASEGDELRLSLYPGQALPGLIGVELGLEFRPVLTGNSAWPVVVLRVADGSTCQRALPRQLTWSRGRTAEERAALIRPKLPTVALSVELIRELLQLTRQSAESPASPQRAPLRKTASKPRRSARTASVAG